MLRRTRLTRSDRLSSVLRWSALCAVWILALVAALVAFPVARAAEAAAVRATSPESVVVGSRSADKPRSVIVEIDRTSPFQVRVQASGIVTELSEPEGPIKTGQPLASVNGEAILAYSASSPLWRDLRFGDRGDDVQGLEELLSELNLLESKPQPLYTSQTAVAVRALQKRIGASQDGIFKLSHVAFVPEENTGMQSATVSVGTPVAAGDPLLSLHPEVAGVRIQGETGVSLADLNDKPVLLTFGGREVELAAAEPVESEYEQIAQIFAQTDQTKGTPGMSAAYTGGMLRLKSPVRVSTFPAGAVYVDAGGDSCVYLRREDTDEWTATKLVTSERSLEIGIIYGQPGLAGEYVVTNPRRAFEKLARCS